MEGTAAWVVVQGAPTPLDLDIEEEVDVSLAWWQIVLVPILIALGGVAQHWMTSRAANRKADADHTGVLLNGYLSQVKELNSQVVTLSARVSSVERTLSRSELARDRTHRLAHRALDRVDDLQAYLSRREEARDRHDPDHRLTPWVPIPPQHLMDGAWTDRRRAELDALEILDAPPGLPDPADDQVGG